MLRKDSPRQRDQTGWKSCINSSSKFRQRSRPVVSCQEPRPHGDETRLRQESQVARLHHGADRHSVKVGDIVEIRSNHSARAAYLVSRRAGCRSCQAVLTAMTVHCFEETDARRRLSCAEQAAKVQQTQLCVHGPRSGPRPGTPVQRAAERNASPPPVGVCSEGGRVWRCAGAGLLLRPP